VTTRHAGFAETVASYRNHGCQGTVAPGPGKMARPYEMSQVIRVGYNLRLSDIQGAVGIAQMDRLDELLAERLSWAMRYTERLKRYSDLVFPAASKKCGHTYQSYVIRMREGGVKRRNMIMEKLAEKGIWSRPGTHAVHRLQVYQDKYKIRPLDFPVACASEDETITLPIFPGMMEKDWEHVVDVLEKAMGQTVS